MKQTAVEWLVEKLKNYDLKMIELFENEIEQAKAMHEEQICTAYLAGDCQNMLAHEYYKETYNQKQ
jgi:hypothetical protein